MVFDEPENVHDRQPSAASDATHAEPFKEPTLLRLYGIPATGDSEGKFYFYAWFESSDLELFQKHDFLLRRRLADIRVSDDEMKQVGLKSMGLGVLSERPGLWSR